MKIKAPRCHQPFKKKKKKKKILTINLMPKFKAPSHSYKSDYKSTVIYYQNGLSNLGNFYLRNETRYIDSDRISTSFNYLNLNKFEFNENNVVRLRSIPNLFPNFLIRSSFPNKFPNNLISKGRRDYR